MPLNVDERPRARETHKWERICILVRALLSFCLHILNVVIVASIKALGSRSAVGSGRRPRFLVLPYIRSSCIYMSASPQSSPPTHTVSIACLRLAFVSRCFETYCQSDGATGQAITIIIGIVVYIILDARRLGATSQVELLDHRIV